MLCQRGLTIGRRSTISSSRLVIETNGVRCYFGDVCERYTSLGPDNEHKPALPNLTDEFLARCEQYFATPAQGRRTIGIPSAPRRSWRTFLSGEYFLAHWV